MIDRDDLYDSESAPGGVGNEPEPQPKTDPTVDDIRHDEKNPGSSWSTNVGQPKPGRFSGTGKGGKNRKGLIASIVIAVLIPLFGLMIHFLSSSLLLPHAKAIISERRLASSTRNFINRVTGVTSTNVLADEETHRILGKSKLGRSIFLYKPELAVRKMRANGTLDFIRDPNTNLITHTIVNKEVLAYPKYKFGHPLANRKAWKQYSRDFYKLNDQALLRDGEGEMVRSRVGKGLIRSYGLKLNFYTARKIRKLNTEAESGRIATEQAAREAQMELFDASTYENTLPREGQAHTDDVSKTAQKALDLEKSCIGTSTCNVHPDQTQLTEASGAGKLIKGYTKRVLDKFNNKYVNAVSIFYTIMVPMCFIYDGSIKTAQSIVRAQETGALRSWYSLSAAADKQVQGNVNGELVGGFNELLKGFSESIPSQYAGNQPFDTTAEPYAQATRAQGYHPFGDDLAWIMNKVCPILLNHLLYIAVLVATGLSLVPVAGQLLSAVKAGLEQIVKKIGEAGLKKFFKHMSEKFVAKLFEKGFERKALKNNAFRFVASNGAIYGLQEGLIKLVQMVVLAEMRTFINAADAGDFVNMADMGAVINNSEQDRIQNYGRPLTPGEVAQVRQADQTSIAYNRGQQSVFQRYFAISNPTSNLSNGIIAANDYVEHPKKIAVAILKAPLSIMSSLKNMIGGMMGHASAATTPNNPDKEDYNTIQWSWTPQEDSIINNENDPSYDPLINTRILDVSGQRSAIETKYKLCYTLPTSDLVTGAGQESNRKIYINEDTGIIEPKLGNCSPNSLSYGNTRFDGGAKQACKNDPVIRKVIKDGGMKASDCSHLVFRWRVDQSYQNAADELNNIQNASTSTNVNNTGSTSVPGGAIPPGAPVGDSSTPCDPRTNDIGINTGYQNGNPEQIRLCALPNLPCGNEECRRLDGINGEYGHGIVNSTVSKQFYEMVEAANAVLPSNLKLSANSTYRTMETQKSLCPCDGVYIAHPGYSNHQMGYAVDFDIKGISETRSSCIQDNGICTAKGHQDWQWLKDNSAKFGLYQYNREFWHFSPTGH